MKSSFWNGRRVFLTGHTGFKGSWLALWLERLGAEVIGYALDPPSEPNLFTLASVGDGMRSLHGDVRDLAQLTRALSEHQPEIVLHLAAQSLVRRSYAEPLETYSTNVLGTANLLEACRNSESVQVVLSVTSDKCYENREHKIGYREEDPLGGKDPYSSSKACAEIVTAAYRDSFFSHGEHQVAIASARAGNVIGGGDFATDRLLPDLIRGFQDGRPVLIRRPGAIRPWQHVLEPLSGYLAITEQAWDDPSRVARAWNFGPDARDERPVEWVADQMVRLWSDGAGWTRDETAHPAEAGFLKLDSTRARSELGWTPLLKLETALDWVVSWHKRLDAGDDARELTLAQIAAYQKLGRELGQDLA